MKNKIYGRFLLAAALFGVFGLGCSHSAMFADNPNEDCGSTVGTRGLTDNRKPASIDQDGKTHHFCTDEARDRFIQAHNINSRY
jgi:hypothetical protein